MKLKTFTAPTMADALAAVRKDFGPDAMILHTRSYRVGSWFGLGGKNMVEITASAGEPAHKNRKLPVRRDRLPDFDDDRHAVLSGETSTPSRSVPPTRPSAPPPRDLSELVVQRANAVVEPKPAFTLPVAAAQQSAAHTAPSQPAPPRSIDRDRDQAGPTPLRSPIATRLPRRDDRPPVRISDATPPAPPSPPATPREPSRFDTEDEIPTEIAAPRAATPTPPAPTQSAPAPADNPAELRGQIAELQKVMGQVLESTRRTSVAMGKVDPRAAEAVEAGPLLKYTTQLVDNDTPMATVDAIIARVRDRLDAAELRDEVVVRQAVLREIEATIDTRSDSLLAISAGATSGRPRVICLVGPTGVGKTTTVAKLAATCKLRHARRVGLITSDTYRIAAVEQLRTYAGIIGLPLKVANTPAEMTQAIADLSAMDVIIVDTAGRSQHDARRLDELKAFITAAAPDETHLVLASTVGETVLQRTADRFKPLGPDRCILTKLDEAVCTGQIAGLTGRIGLPLSFVTVGQEVPDDIEPARPDRLARVALDGPGVWCKGSDGRG
jgi:flagellar biosynthesis protein FlhF